MVTRQILKLTCTPEVHVLRVYSEKVWIHVYFFKNSVYFGVLRSLVENTPGGATAHPVSVLSMS